MIAQIEEVSGVDSINEIAAVKGLDAVFLGPSDLTIASLPNWVMHGSTRLGQLEHELGGMLARDLAIHAYW